MGAAVPMLCGRRVSAGSTGVAGFITFACSVRCRSVSSTVPGERPNDARTATLKPFV
jgi:hypothetical protein